MPRISGIIEAFIDTIEFTGQRSLVVVVLCNYLFNDLNLCTMKNLTEGFEINQSYFSNDAEQSRYESGDDNRSSHGSSGMSGRGRSSRSGSRSGNGRSASSRSHSRSSGNRSRSSSSRSRGR